MQCHTVLPICLLLCDAGGLYRRNRTVRLPHSVMWPSRPDQNLRTEHDLCGAEGIWFIRVGCCNISPILFLTVLVYRSY